MTLATLFRWFKPCATIPLIMCYTVAMAVIREVTCEAWRSIQLLTKKETHRRG